MKAFLIYLLILLSLITSLKAAEQKKLYKRIDSNGKVYYSDTPQEGAEEVQIKPLSTTEIKATPLIKIKKAPVEDVKPDFYQNLSIISPADDTEIRNNAAQATLTASVQPAVDKEHRVQFFIDGKQVSQDSQALTITVNELDYGTHIAQVKIVDAEGTVLKTSAQSKFYLLTIPMRKN